MICKSLRLFVKTMGVVDKCSLSQRNKLIEPIHMQLSQKLKTFFRFILRFRNLGSILDIFRKNLTLIAYFFLRLRAAKCLVRYMCKSHASDYPSKGNMINVSQLFLNLSDRTCGIFIAQREDN